MTTRSLVAILLFSIFATTPLLAAEPTASAEEKPLVNKLLSEKYHTAATKAQRAIERLGNRSIDEPVPELRRLKAEEAIDAADDAQVRSADYCVQKLFRDWLHRVSLADISRDGWQQASALRRTALTIEIMERANKLAREQMERYYAEQRAASDLQMEIRRILLNLAPPCDPEERWLFVSEGVKAFANNRNIPVHRIERDGLRLTVFLAPGVEPATVREACEDLKKEWAQAWEGTIEGAVFVGCASQGIQQ